MDTRIRISISISISGVSRNYSSDRRKWNDVKVDHEHGSFCCWFTRATGSGQPSQPNHQQRHHNQFSITDCVAYSATQRARQLQSLSLSLSLLFRLAVYRFLCLLPASCRQSPKLLGWPLPLHQFDWVNQIHTHTHQPAPTEAGPKINPNHR